jgi:uncharacterized membrane protein
MKDDGEFRGTSTGLRLIDIASIVVITAIAGAAILVWQAGPPGLMPLHFNAAGQVDRWGDHNEMAMVIAMMGVVAAGVAAYCLMFERYSKDPAAERFTYRLGRIVGLAAPGLVALLLTLVAFDRLPHGETGETPLLRVMMGGVALLVLGLGAFLGRTKPNPVVGVRTYWSLRSRLAWDKSNRLAGRLFSVVGVLGLIATAAAPLPLGFHAMMIGVIISSLIAAVESWRVWRTDPNRA